VARSNNVSFALGVAEPTQAHITLTDDPTEMRYALAGAHTEHEDASTDGRHAWYQASVTRSVEFITGTWDTPYVEYGTAPGNYTARVAGTSRTYTADMVRRQAVSRRERFGLS